MLCFASNSHTVGPSKDLKQVTSGCRGNFGSLQLHSGIFLPLGQAAVATGRCNPKSGKCAINIIVKQLQNMHYSFGKRQCLNLEFTVLSRTFTCEELLAPGAPFIKKILTVGFWQFLNEHVIKYVKQLKK